MQYSAAFFDVDETVINIKSMFDFFSFWCHERNEHDQLESYMTQFRAEVKKGTPREELNKTYYRQFTGAYYKDLVDAGEIWFRHKLNSELFINSVIFALRKHQTENTCPVFISGSMLPVLSPIAKHLGVEDILCTPLKFSDMGIVTGEIGIPQTIGTGKRDALIHFCNERKISPLDCYSYGDDLSDIPMLEITGHPVCVGKNTALANHAMKYSWPII